VRAVWDWGVDEESLYRIWIGWTHGKRPLSVALSARRGAKPSGCFCTT